MTDLKIAVFRLQAFVIPINQNALSITLLINQFIRLKREETKMTELFTKRKEKKKALFTKMFKEILFDCN